MISESSQDPFRRYYTEKGSVKDDTGKIDPEGNHSLFRKRLSLIAFNSQIYALDVMD